MTADEREDEREDAPEAAAEETGEAAATGDAPAAPAEDAPAAEAGEPAAEAGDDEPAAEAKPKRRTRRRKADEADAKTDEADAKADEADAKADEADAKADEAEAKDEGEEKPKPARRRRGSAETTAGARKRAPRREGAAGHVVVRARAKYVRCAPRKARLVVDHIRGKPVEEARAILRHTTRSAAQDVLKVLNSAVANAEHNHELDADELVVHQAFVDEGPTLKRYRPRAQGRATRIRKRTSHLTIAVATKP